MCRVTCFYICLRVSSYVFSSENYVDSSFKVQDFFIMLVIYIYLMFLLPLSDGKYLLVVLHFQVRRAT